MEKQFFQFVFKFLAELGVSPEQLLQAYAEHAGLRGLKQLRNLRDLLLQKHGIEVNITVQAAEPAAPEASKEQE